MGERMTAALPIVLGTPRLPDTGRSWAWVVDRDHILKGLDALSLVLSAGMKVLPVVDAPGRLLGEISMDA